MQLAAAPRAPPCVRVPPRSAIRSRLHACDPARSEAGYLRSLANTPAELLCDEESQHGNGRVRVLRHGDWLVMRCESTEQGIAFSDNGAAAPQVLGFHYLRVMAAAAVGAGSLDAGRLLCVGLGSGALPGFLAHHFGGACVQVAEVDPLVVRLAREHFHVRFTRAASVSLLVGSPQRGLTVLEADAGAVVCALAAAVSSGSTPGASALFIDAYAAYGTIPAHLRGTDFLTACAASLAIGGVVCVNLFTGSPNSRPRRDVELYAKLLMQALDGPVYSLTSAGEHNVVLLASKGRALCARELCEQATRVSQAGCWEWDAGALVQQLFQCSFREEGGADAVAGELTEGLEPLSADESW